MPPRRRAAAACRWPCENGLDDVIFFGDLNSASLLRQYASKLGFACAALFAKDDRSGHFLAPHAMRYAEGPPLPKSQDEQQHFVDLARRYFRRRD